MVNSRKHEDDINLLHTSTTALGSVRNGTRRSVRITFPDSLFAQIRREAVRREWSFSHMVRYLCDASIEGIE